MKSDLRDLQFERIIAEVEDYAILLLDKNGTITTWNKASEKITGYSADEIIGENYKVFYSKEDRDAHLPDTLLELATKKGKITHEGWRVRKDGSKFWGSVTITVIYDDDKKITGYLKVTRDLTERKVAEDNILNYAEYLKVKNEALRKSEERYHRMVSEVRDYAIILLDTDGTILDWNKGAEHLKGYSTSEIIGKNFRIFYPKEHIDSKLPEQLLQVAVKNGSVTHEGWRIRKDGNRFWGNAAITALHNDNGQIIGFSKVTRDLTEKKLPRINSAIWRRTSNKKMKS